MQHIKAHGLQVPSSALLLDPWLLAGGPPPGQLNRLQLVRTVDAGRASGRSQGEYLLDVTASRVNRRSRDLHSFLGTNALASVDAEPLKGKHHEFLFGTSPHAVVKGVSSKDSFEMPLSISMMPAASEVSAVASTFATAVWKEGKKLLAPIVDPFSDETEFPQETGWNLMIPRTLRLSYWTDIISLATVAHSAFYFCDVPLRSWLIGGVMLGFPVSTLVNRLILKDSPRFSSIRLTVKKIRGGGDPSRFKLDSLVLYNRFNQPIHRSLVGERYEANYWFVQTREGPEPITGYQLITHRTAEPGTDPVSWIVEGSADGENWQVIDETDNENLPRQREKASQKYEDLDHIPDSVAAFRQGFIAEVGATALSFAWLILGTSWVSAGTEACVDSAPILWYWSYFLVVIVWSFLGTITIGLIVSAVAMIVLGAKSQPS
eukprot:TRINITY_DN4178_c0_g1_i1.p1 TRINITY_DN4178_c0_g1~~TRINITY_DN4178_c0_g1_i1.p1  ORF type:complete len:433 (+),score=57.40 TRINITY_DN4178_c0_g1_i1:51-1349(+)